MKMDASSAIAVFCDVDRNMPGIPVNHGAKQDWRYIMTNAAEEQEIVANHRGAEPRSMDQVSLSVGAADFRSSDQPRSTSR